jgi:hypothetical protein
MESIPSKNLPLWGGRLFMNDILIFQHRHAVGFSTLFVINRLPGFIGPIPSAALDKDEY